MLFIALILFVLGLILLIKGANLLVSGASSLSLILKISPVVIGLTVVAFGTSSPELLVSVTSALNGNTELALANVVGSNIANILLILGVSALFAPLAVKKNTTWKEIPMSFLGALVMVVLGLQEILDFGRYRHEFFADDNVIGSITFSNGLILIGFFIIFLYYTFGIAKVEGDTSEDIKKIPLPRSIVYIVLGLVGLGFGSTLLVDNATIIARVLGVSDRLIGLTLIAVGTSLPELVTSITAAMKKQVDLAVGNVIGSNIFNIFFVLGATSLVRPIPITSDSLIDIGFLFVSTVIMFLTLFVMKRHEIVRSEGIIFLILYTIYLIHIILRG